MNVPARPACPGGPGWGLCYPWDRPPGRAARAPGPRVARIPEVTVNLKRVLVWLAIAFVLFYVIQQPESSADMVRSAGEALGDAASSFATFVSSLV